MQTGNYVPVNFIHSGGDGKRLPVTIASGLQLAAGTALGIVTSTGLGVLYNPAAATGEERCVGILCETVDTTSAGLNRAYECTRIVGKCTLIKSALTGIDDSGISDLGGRVINFDGVDLVYLP